MEIRPRLCKCLIYGERQGKEVEYGQIIAKAGYILNWIYVVEDGHCLVVENYTMINKMF